MIRIELLACEWQQPVRGSVILQRGTEEHPGPGPLIQRRRSLLTHRAILIETVKRGDVVVDRSPEHSVCARGACAPEVVPRCLPGLASVPAEAQAEQRSQSVSRDVPHSASIAPPAQTALAASQNPSVVDLTRLVRLPRWRH
jgi:hypothetical protein